MDWQEEKYVRVYVRDTAEWRALCWQAKAVWPLLLRQCNRAGVVAIRHTEKRVRLLAGLIDMPLEVTEPGIADLLDDGCVVECEVGYLVPNFIEAQEAKASDAKRARDSRERKRDLAAAGALLRPAPNPAKFQKKVAPTGGMSRFVTNPPETPPKQPESAPLKNGENDTLRDAPSRFVTNGHTGEQNVTLYCAVPSFSDGARASSLAAGAQAALAIQPEAEEISVPSHPTNQPKALPGSGGRGPEWLPVPPVGWVVGLEEADLPEGQKAAATVWQQLLEGVGAYTASTARLRDVVPLAVTPDALVLGVADEQAQAAFAFASPCLTALAAPRTLEVRLGHHPPARARKSLTAASLGRLWHEGRKLAGLASAPCPMDAAAKVLTEAAGEGFHQNGILAYALMHFLFDPGIKARGRPFGAFVKVWRDRAQRDWAERAGYFY